jgi:hypothetical protein
MKEDEIIITEVHEGSNVTHKLTLTVTDYPVNLPQVQAPVIVGYACTCPKTDTPFLVIEPVAINSVEITPAQRIYAYKGMPAIDLKQAKTDFFIAAKMLRAKFPKV